MARREVSGTTNDHLSMIQKIARKTADVAPIAGGILGGTAGFALGTPTGPGALLSGAAGTAVGTGGGLAIKNGLEQVFKLPTDQTQKERAVESIAEPAIAGAADLATGGILRGAGSLLGKVARGGSKRLMNMAFRESVPETKAVIRAGKETLGEQALTKGEIGTPDGIFKKAVVKIEEIEDVLQSKLLKSNKTVSLKEVEKTVQPLITEYRQSGNVADANALETRIVNLREAWGEKIPLDAANRVKRTLYTEARNAYGKVASENMEGIKALARGFKEQIETFGGKSGEIAKMNQDLSYYGRVADSMADKMTKDRNNIMSIITAALFSGGLPSAVPTGGASLIPAIANGIVNTVPGQTVTANVLKTLPKIGSKIEPGVDILRRIGTQAVSGSVNQ